MRHAAEKKTTENKTENMPLFRVCAVVYPYTKTSIYLVNAIIYTMILHCIQILPTFIVVTHYILHCNTNERKNEWRRKKTESYSTEWEPLSNEYKSFAER